MTSRALHQWATRAEGVDPSARNAGANTRAGGTERPGIPDAAGQQRRTSVGLIRTPRQGWEEVHPRSCATLLQKRDTRNASSLVIAEADRTSSHRGPWRSEHPAVIRLGAKSAIPAASGRTPDTPTFKNSPAPIKLPV